MKNEFLKNPDDFFGHAHAATITEHKGELFSAWYVYKEKESENGQVVYALFNKNLNLWSKSSFAFPMMIGTSQGNPVLYSYQDKLYMYFVVLKRNYWNSAELFLSYLDNKKQEWSSPKKLSTDEGIMVRHRPMVVGDFGIVPAYDEISMKTILYRFQTDPSKLVEYCRLPQKMIQGDLISFNKNECQMYLRSADDNRKVIKVVSSDCGKEWHPPRETNLHCPLSGIAAIILQSGKILVANNHTEKHKRTPISLSLSDTKGLDFDLGTWHVDSSDIELSYPSLIQDSLGIIHLVFTFNRKMIKWISFTEAELISKLDNK
jgi:predicted neuraminidase